MQSLSTTFSRVSSSSLVELGSWRVAVPGLPVGPRFSRRRPYVRSLSPPNINFVMQPVLLCNSRLRAFLNYLNLVYYTHTHTHTHSHPVLCSRLARRIRPQKTRCVRCAPLVLEARNDTNQRRVYNFEGKRKCAWTLFGVVPNRKRKF